MLRPEHLIDAWILERIAALETRLAPIADSRVTDAALLADPLTPLRVGRALTEHEAMVLNAAIPGAHYAAGDFYR